MRPHCGAIAITQSHTQSVLNLSAKSVTQARHTISEILLNATPGSIVKYRRIYILAEITENLK